MVKDRSTSSVNISQVQNNEVSETNIFIFLLTLHREICSVQQCAPRWGGLGVLGLVMCAMNSTSGWRNLWYQLKIHFVGGLQIRICTLVFLTWQSMSTQHLVSSCISFSSATTHNVLATVVDVERSFSRGRILINHLHNRLRASSIRALMCFGDWCHHQLVLDADLAAALHSNVAAAERRKGKAKEKDNEKED